MVSVSLNSMTLRLEDSHFTIQPHISLGPLDRTPPITIKKFIWRLSKESVSGKHGRQSISQLASSSICFLVHQRSTPLRGNLGREEKAMQMRSLVKANTILMWPMRLTTFAGWPNYVTPFNGEHNAGILVLNTGNFTDERGPLFDLKP